MSISDVLRDAVHRLNEHLDDEETPNLYSRQTIKRVIKLRDEMNRLRLEVNSVQIIVRSNEQ